MGFIQPKHWRICHLILGITYLTSGIILNVIQGSLYYLLRPVNKRLYRKLNYYVNYSLYCQLVFLAQWWADVRLTVHIDPDDLKKYFGREHGYLLMNHTYDIDWLVGWILCDYVRLLGNCKTYAKKAIQYIPTMGWAWKFGESVFLERNWDKDKEIIGNQLKELVDYPDPMWLLLMAEGTRFTPEKHQASQQFAQDAGLPLLKYHLTPRTRGFISSLPYLRGKVPAAYNVCLGIRNDGERPTMANVILGKRIEASMYMERIPIDEIPEGDKEASAWLHELYLKKDLMLQSFLETGSWQANDPKITKTVPVGKLLPRRWAPLLNTIFWAFVVLIPIMQALFSLILSGSILNVTLGIAIVFAFLLLLGRLVGTTKSSQGSSYGTSGQSTPNTPVAHSSPICTDTQTR